jgi:hypothetical protein
VNRISLKEPVTVASVPLSDPQERAAFTDRCHRAFKEWERTVGSTDECYTFEDIFMAGASAGIYYGWKIISGDSNG